MEKSTAKNSVASSAPRLELVTPLLEKLLVDVCPSLDQIVHASAVTSAPRGSGRQNRLACSGPKHGCRAARQQPFHDVRCKCRWRLNRRADCDLRKTLQDPCAEKGARVRRVDVTDSPRARASGAR